MLKCNYRMLRKLAYFIYSHELLLGILGFMATFLFYIVFPGPVTFARSLPMCLSWFCAFLVGDWASRRLGEGSIFPHRKNQLHKLKRLMLAAYLMNFISDSTGSWLLKLWYYPFLHNVYLYLFVFAPLGYVLFGYILYVFYRLFKHHWDYKVKRGRPHAIAKTIYLWIMNAELVIGLVGCFVSVLYYYQFITQHNIVWYAFDARVNASVNIYIPILLWISIFFLMEYACFVLKRETLTRDIVRGNPLPLLSILLASVCCIVLVELFNAPFQAWTFINWPYQSIRLFSIPILAYAVWPMQYLLLLPLIRLIDGKNEENVW